MSTLTSSSTLADAKAAFFDNASYEEDASTSKASAFITACRFLLLMIPRSHKHGDDEQEFSPSMIKAEMDRARAWLDLNSSTASVGATRSASFEGFR